MQSICTVSVILIVNQSINPSLIQTLGP